MTESPDGSRPGRLPCQLLGHGTGYLAAAAVLEGIRWQSQAGGTHIFELSLAATTAWLLRQPGGRVTRNYWMGSRRMTGNLRDVCVSYSLLSGQYADQIP
jgi:hypothetical protein